MEGKTLLRPSLVLALLPCLGEVPAAAEVSPPAPFGPVPTERQLRWHEMEFYGFLHFTVNTFTDKEWGFGDEDEKVFDPTAFDADQIVRTLKESPPAPSSWRRRRTSGARSRDMRAGREARTVSW